MKAHCACPVAALREWGETPDLRRVDYIRDDVVTLLRERGATE